MAVVSGEFLAMRQRSQSCWTRASYQLHPGNSAFGNRGSNKKIANNPWFRVSLKHNLPLLAFPELFYPRTQP
jgi:hypothetical protein